MLIREPDKGYCQLLVVRDGLPEWLLVLAVCLANLSLNPVTVDGVLKALLGYADENLHWRMILTPFRYLIDNPKGKGR